VQILEDTQKAFGYISRESIGHIADFLNISREQVVEAASFYPLFRTEPPARYRISVCRGETCSRKGSDELRELIERDLRITDGETTPDGLFSLEMVPCRGLDSESPHVLVNDLPIPAKTPEEVSAHLRSLANGKP